MHPHELQEENTTDANSDDNLIVHYAPGMLIGYILKTTINSDDILFCFHSQHLIGSNMAKRLAAIH